MVLETGFQNLGKLKRTLHEVLSNDRSNTASKTVDKYHNLIRCLKCKLITYPRKAGNDTNGLAFGLAVSLLTPRSTLVSMYPNVSLVSRLERTQGIESKLK